MVWREVRNSEKVSPAAMSVIVWGNSGATNTGTNYMTHPRGSYVVHILLQP